MHFSSTLLMHWLFNLIKLFLYCSTILIPYNLVLIRSLALLIKWRLISKLFMLSEFYIKLSITGTDCCITIMYFKNSLIPPIFCFFLCNLYTWIMFFNWKYFNFYVASYIVYFFYEISFISFFISSKLLIALLKKSKFLEILFSSSPSINC